MRGMSTLSLSSKQEFIYLYQAFCYIHQRCCTLAYCHYCPCSMLSMEVVWLHGENSECFTSCSLCKSFDWDCSGTNLLIYSVSFSGSFSQSGSFRFWPGFPSSVLQLPTMLRSHGSLVAAMETRVWGSFLSALTGKWVWIRTLTQLAPLTRLITVYFWWCESYDYPTQSTGMIFLVFCGSKASYIILNSSRVSWVTFFACRISPLWFRIFHWTTFRVVFVVVYYNNIWKAQNFPFVSPQSGLAEHWR